MTTTLDGSELQVLGLSVLSGECVGELAKSLDALKERLPKPKDTETPSAAAAQQEEPLDEEMPTPENMSAEDAEMLSSWAGSDEAKRKQLWSTIVRIGKRRRVVPAAAVPTATVQG